jgi:hypothetical protein
MDDDKKKEVKEIEIEVVIFIALVILVIAWPAILAYLKIMFPFLNGDGASQWGSSVVSIGKSIFSWLVAISVPLSVFFLIGIIYCTERLKHIRKKEAEKFDLKVEEAFEPEPVSGDAKLAERWTKIKSEISSANPNDWRQAILEADIMLEDVLIALGYQGEGIGEKLKRVVTGDMKALNEAWEAHKVRNQIAHDGLSFPLTQHEANRVVGLYKKVFEEFYQIKE